MKEELEKNESLRAFHDSIRTTIETVGEAFPNGDEIEESHKPSRQIDDAGSSSIRCRDRSEAIQFNSGCAMLRYSPCFWEPSRCPSQASQGETTAQPELSDSIVEEGLVEPDSEFRFISRKQAGLEEGQATEDLLHELARFRAPGWGFGGC